MTALCGVVCTVVEVAIALLLLNWGRRRWSKLNDRIYSIGHELGVLKVVRRNAPTKRPQMGADQARGVELPERRQVAR
jgi:hypothetical protein